MRCAAPVVSALLLAAGCSAIAAASDLPPVGRSLFDHVTSRRIDGRIVQRIPYPFQSLLAELEAHAGTDPLGRPGIAAVLIPMGRSLQRNASPGDYFRHPRVVAAITGEVGAANVAAPLLKDRLFLGFQDETDVIEVISYNERAGRFEFQIVTDYRQGSTPKVLYARRAVCTTCHHGAAPIFSRPSWDETNANPVVARALAAHAKSFHGVPVARGVDVPNAIDDAVARANRIAVTQTIWRDGCARVSAPNDAVGCRGAALFAALRLRLTGAWGTRQAGDMAADDPLTMLVSAWRAKWPEGVPEPDPNIPNRDPFFGEAQQLGIPASRLPYGADEIPPALDPIASRPPAGVWRADAAGVDRFVRSLAEMFAVTDIVQLARSLEPARAASTPIPAAARLDAGTARSSDRYDLDRLRRALAALATDTRAGRSSLLGDAAFQRTPTVKALFSHLGLTGTVCCDHDDSALPAARAEHEHAVDAAARSTPLQPFYEHCSICHASPAASPPGFLFGDASTVQRNLSRCAARIRYRLAMWRVTEGARTKVPMPPPVFVPSWIHAPPRADLDRMMEHVDQELDAGTRDRLLTLRYETLPACREPAPPTAKVPAR